MANTAVPFYPSSLVNAGLLLNNASGTTVTTFYTATGNGAKIESLSVTSTDTSARVLTVTINVGGTDYTVGSINVPIAAGTDAAITAAVSVLEPTSMLPWVRRDSNGRGYLYLALGNILKFNAQVAITAAKVIHIVGQIGVY